MVGHTLEHSLPLVDMVIAMTGACSNRTGGLWHFEAFPDFRVRMLPGERPACRPAARLLLISGEEAGPSEICAYNPAYK